MSGQPRSYAVWTGPLGVEKERDTFCCAHCNKIQFVEPKKATEHSHDLGGFCRRCDKPICGPCADKGVCVPFEEKLRRMEAKDKLVKAILG